MPPHARRLTHALAAVLALALLAGACGEDGSADATPPPSVRIAAGAQSLTVGGTFEAGVNRITFSNDGQRARNAQIVRLDDGYRPADLLAAIEARQRWPEWAHYAGGPGLTEPGRSMTFEAVLEAGQYVLLSLLPDNGGALQVEPEVVQAFAVTGEPSDARRSQPNLTVTAIRRGLEAPSSVREGEVRLRLVNEDDTPHDVSVFRLDRGATVADAVAYLDGRRRGAPGIFVGGVQAVESGEDGLAVLFLEPGEYALLSLFPEPDGVTPGFQVGLARGLTVE